jgi:hypothetical protein
MGAPPVATPILNYNTYVATASFSARVRVWIWTHAGVTAQASWFTTDGSVEQWSSPVTQTTRAAGETTMTVSIVAGKTYLVRAISNTDNEGVYAIAQLEPV